MAQIPAPLISHTRKVCSLYKRACRTVRDWNPEFFEQRYQLVLLRKRFDDNRNIKDLRVAKKLLVDGEEELFKNAHYQPWNFPNTIGGLAYGRTQVHPDHLLDTWHPMERARYPKFFAERERMKKEYMEFYYKQYPEERPGNKPETTENH